MSEMGNDGIRIVHSDLDTAADDMRRASDDIENRLTRLDSELTPLKSDWTGRAQMSYTQAKRNWDAAILEMKQLLDQSKVALMQSNSDFQSADIKGAQSFDY